MARAIDRWAPRAAESILFCALLRGCRDVYPMQRDDTCFVLAAGFDKSHLQEDVRAILR